MSAPDRPRVLCCLIESAGGSGSSLRSSRNIVAREGWRKRRQTAGKGRAIGIGGVSSTGDNLAAEASGYWIEVRSREADDPIAQIGAADKAQPIMPRGIARTGRARRWRKARDRGC